MSEPIGNTFSFIAFLPNCDRLRPLPPPLLLFLMSRSLQVRIDEVDEQWCGSLHVGLTTLAPPELPSCPLSGLSPSLTQLRTKVTWLLCGSEVRRNGVLQRQNYSCSLDRLAVRSRHLFSVSDQLSP